MINLVVRPTGRSAAAGQRWMLMAGRATRSPKEMIYFVQKVGGAVSLFLEILAGLALASFDAAWSSWVPGGPWCVFRMLMTHWQRQIEKWGAPKC